MNPEQVDVFWGSQQINLPQPEGLAAAWPFLKAQAGNTSPGPTRPLGMLAVCPFTGGYPTGYGINKLNCHGLPAKQPHAPRIQGFTHFQQSGTGAIQYYYNYLRVTPFVGETAPVGRGWPLLDERAEPGWYACTFGGTEISAETTVSEHVAAYRFTFPRDGQAGLWLDLSAGGWDTGDLNSRPVAAAVHQVSARELQAEFEHHGIKFYCRIELMNRAGGYALGAAGAAWNGEEVRWQRTGAEPFGVLVRPEPDAAGSVELRIAFSLRNPAQADANLHAEAGGRSFAAIRQATRMAWAEALGRIEVSGGSESARRLFASALYHSLVKPSDLHGESPFPGAADIYLDFATLWDVYKTQLPLAMTLLPERRRDLVEGYLNVVRQFGFLNSVLYQRDRLDIEDQQARALGFFPILDAFHRGERNLAYDEILNLMLKELAAPHHEDFRQTGRTHRPTHTLDLAQAFHSAAELAQHLGRTAEAEELARAAGCWRNVMDPTTGLLTTDGEYYEGTHWNYSFRLLPDMAGRIGLFSSPEAFVAALDQFFGRGATPVQQLTDPHDTVRHQAAYDLHRFEGFNNEPDMETPYAYLYAGRHDRCCEVLEAARRYMFVPGPGGCPGNNDSGGLSATYVWNCLGLFPVSGQPVMLLGSPAFPEARIRTGESELVIHSDRNSADEFYVRQVYWHGRPLDRAWLTLDELAGGGTLEFKMSATPTRFGADTPPPSFVGAESAPTLCQTVS